MKNIFFTDESVKIQITGSISENLTDSNLESTKQMDLKGKKFCQVQKI